MSFKISWLGFSGKEKSFVLANLNIIDTGVSDEANESPMSCASFPNDWTIIWLNRFDHPIMRDKSLRWFSGNCAVIAAQIHEGMMFSATQFYRDGVPEWSVIHDAQKGLYDLQTEGTPPAMLSDIHTRLIAEQDENGGENARVDCLFDVPVEIAQAICGFRHDLCKYEWGEPQFTILEGQRDAANDFLET